MAVEIRIGDALSVPRNMSDRRARERAGDHRPPPRNLEPEQAARAEAKLHKLLEGALRTHSERRTIGTVASEGTTDFGQAYHADGAPLGLPVGVKGLENCLGGHRAPDYMERTASRLKRPGRHGLLIVDYLQLMRSSRLCPRTWCRSSGSRL